MAIDLKILGWEVKGLRCPDYEVSFEKDDKSVNPITLIQMPNGVGKTTTLKLLRAALAGPKIWDSGFDNLAQFKKNNSVEKGHFILKLLHNERRLTISLNFDFNNNGSYFYKTTRFDGIKDEYTPPDELRRFFTPEFVKLLIFDGELASNLMDASHTNAQMAIEEMYQLTIFKWMHGKIDEYWNEIAENYGAGGSSKEYSRRRNKVKSLYDRIQMVTNERNKDTKVISDIKESIQKMNIRFEKELENNTKDKKDKEKAEKVLENAKLKLKTKTKDLVTIMKIPSELSNEFSIDIKNLKNSLDKVKLPGIAAREFFEEIAEQPSCICGREINLEIKNSILSRKNEYLGSEEVAVLNAMKADIRERVDEKENGIILKELVSEVEKAEEKVSISNNHLDHVIKKASRDPEIKNIRKAIEIQQKLLGQYEEKFEKYNENNDSDDSWNLSILEKRYEKAEKELASTTDTIELKTKKDYLQRILDKAFEQSKTSLNDNICKIVNDKIKNLMPNNDIRVDSIDKCLRLRGKDGGSAGETLSIGYAFLSTLLQQANHSLPFVVDSPSGPIDLEVRSEIGSLLPNLGKQFIAFVISSERQNFVNPLAKASSDPIQFITLFRKSNKKLEANAKHFKNKKESDDGIWVFGEDFFNKFHLDKQ